MTIDKKQLSEVMRELAAKRKNPYHGFQSPEVQKKAQESRRKKKHDSKNVPELRE